MKTNLTYLVAASIAAAPIGCGGSTGSHDNASDAGPETAAPVGEAGAPDVVEAGIDADHGAPSTTYPAFTPDIGQLVFNGGYVMLHPVIVPITWDSDPGQPAFDSFVDAIGSTDYWRAVTKDYNVGPATSGTRVHLTTTAPAQLTDADIQALVTKNTAASAADAGAGEAGAGDAGDADGATTPAWQSPTADTIYTFFLPPKTSLLISGFGSQTPSDACSQGIGGYHGAVPAKTPGGTDIAYAVVPSCKFPGLSATNESTMSMSHELTEAVTDPFSSDMAAQNVGWYGFDSPHFAWTYFNELQGEVGDVCEFYPESFYQEASPFPYYVQRMWSNASARAGHHPCVPNPPGAYFNVTPLDLPKVNVTIPSFLGGGMGLTKGVHIRAGQTATFTVGFYSDGPTSGPWTITATPGNPVLAQGGGDFLSNFNSSNISATIDKTSGVNGERAVVTVSVATTGASFQGELLTITSTMGQTSHYMPIWIGGE